MKRYRSRRNSRNKCSEAKESFEYLRSWEAKPQKITIPWLHKRPGVRSWRTLQIIFPLADFVLDFKSHGEPLRHFSKGLSSSDWYLFWSSTCKRKWQYGWIKSLKNNFALILLLSEIAPPHQPFLMALLFEQKLQEHLQQISFFCRT